MVVLMRVERSAKGAAMAHAQQASGFSDRLLGRPMPSQTHPFRPNFDYHQEFQHVKSVQYPLNDR